MFVSVRDTSPFVSSAQAVAILRQETGRPRASRTSLKYLVDAGRITPVVIHARCSLYDPDQVAAVARSLVVGGGVE